MANVFSFPNVIEIYTTNTVSASVIIIIVTNGLCILNINVFDVNDIAYFSIMIVIIVNVFLLKILLQSKLIILFMLL